VWRTFRSAPAAAPASTSAAPAAAGPVIERHGRAEIGCLALAYGLAGLGYIVTATFLPVIARAALPGSPWLDMFWPVFGVGVMIGALLATRIRPTRDMRLLLAGCYIVQAAGIAIGVWSPSLPGFAIGSLLLGIPFTAITFFAMQEVRRLRPLLIASFMGLLTAVYGVGQIAGPPMVALLLRRSSSTGAGFTLALEIAAVALLVGALMYAAMWRLWPMRR
jgi:predicted MFS family arabinose efflux permease